MVLECATGYYLQQVDYLPTEPNLTTTTDSTTVNPYTTPLSVLEDQFLQTESKHSKECDPKETILRLIGQSNRSMSDYNRLEQFLETLEKESLNQTTQQQKVDNLEQQKLDDSEDDTQNELDSSLLEREQLVDTNEIDQVKTRKVNQPIKAAVRTTYSMEYRPVDIDNSQQYVKGGDAPSERVIEVIPRDRPLEIHFKSLSSRIRVRQSSLGAQQKIEPERSSSEEEPRKYFHQIKKPIIQEVHEIIMPFRKVYQEIQPVVEEVHTVVSSANKTPNKFNSKYQPRRPMEQIIRANSIGMNGVNQIVPPSPLVQYQNVRSQKYQRNVSVKSANLDNFYTN